MTKFTYAILTAPKQSTETWFKHKLGQLTRFYAKSGRVNPATIRHLETMYSNARILGATND